MCLPSRGILPTFHLAECSPMLSCTLFPTLCCLISCQMPKLETRYHAVCTLRGFRDDISKTGTLLHDEKLEAEIENMFQRESPVGIATFILPATHRNLTQRQFLLKYCFSRWRNESVFVLVFGCKPGQRPFGVSFLSFLQLGSSTKNNLMAHWQYSIRRTTENFILFHWLLYAMLRSSCYVPMYRITQGISLLN